MRLLAASLASCLLCSSAGATSVQSIRLRGDAYAINGRQAAYAGSGDFKEVLVHPADAALVVKVFYAKAASSVPELRREAAALKALEPLGVSPRLIEQGAVTLRGQKAGYLVEERVQGSTLEGRLTPSKLRSVRALFDKLLSGGLELTDVALDFKLRENIMVGTTRSGPAQAYLVDPAVQPSEKSAAELAAFYDGLLARLARR